MTTSRTFDDKLELFDVASGGNVRFTAAGILSHYGRVESQAQATSGAPAWPTAPRGKEFCGARE
jgi:hypothetical protein